MQFGDSYHGMRKPTAPGRENEQQIEAIDLKKARLNKPREF